MILKHNKEEVDVIPLFRIIKKEYGLINIFFIVFSMLSMGIFSTLIKIHTQESEYFYLFLFCMVSSFLVLVIGFLPFIRKIFKDIFVITWPSFGNIVLQFIKVVIFAIILVCTVKLFEQVYSEFLDPFKLNK
ncbi:hypothetical protein ['Camptotheca acuminata' phytoplasma]|uniref:hypothetical protein n=1 Tax='Camptotheca acuminata' phytoplasma TaxID=3239192 RepID=UPI00351A1145